MQTLGKAVGRSGHAGEPLPSVFRSFTAAKINFRRSATSMIAGWPGSFKTALALNLMVEWAKQGLHGMYISADDDAVGIAGRVGAMISGYPVDAVEEGLREGNPFYTRTLDTVGSLRFIFTATDIDEVDRHMRGFEELYGEFPDFVVIDNLMNVVESDNEWSAMRNMTRDLALVSRDAKTHFLILHHTSESWGEVGVPQPRAAIQGKVSQFPQLILNVGANGAVLNVCAVKNRHGPQDPSGKSLIPFQVYTDTMRVREMWTDQQTIMEVA